jgi:hypothetical protein
MSNPAAVDLPAIVAPQCWRWRRLLVLLFLLVAVLVCAAWAARWALHRWSAQRELDAVIALLDQADPGWQLDELEASRKAIPEDKNAALAVGAIRRLLPEQWKPEDPPARPERRISPAQTEELRKVLLRAAAALNEARALADYAEGRYPNISSPDPIGASPGCDAARDVALLLRLQVKLLAEENDGDGAMTAALASLAVARSIGDEPRLLAQQARLRCQSDALAVLERTLAQTQPSEAVLARLQRALELEDQAPLLLWAAKGERAGYHQLALAAEAGDIPVNKVLLHITPEDSLVQEMLAGPSAGTALRRCHAEVLGYLTQLVELARRPCAEQGPLIREMAAERPGFFDGYQLFPGLENRERGIPDTFRRQTALIRCAIIAIAAERYRVANGSWPEALAALVPLQLAQAPTDPFTGLELHLTREKDGLKITALGQELPQSAEPSRPPSTVGVRLWDVLVRRQEPRPEDPGAQPMRPGRN